jgi:phosphoribosylpyrophosphate synthetase
VVVRWLAIASGRDNVIATAALALFNEPALKRIASAFERAFVTDMSGRPVRKWPDVEVLSISGLLAQTIQNASGTTRSLRSSRARTSL